MLEHYFNIPKLVVEMQRHYSTKKTNHKKYLKKYLTAVRAYCWQGINLATDEQIKNNQIPFAWNEVRRNSGKYGPRTKEKYWFDWIQEHNPLIKCIKKGSKFGGAVKGKLTMIETTIPIEYIIACDDPKEAFEMTYGVFDQEVLADTNKTDWIEIDTVSLDRFIRSSQAELENEMTKEKRDQYLRNLKHARHLMLIARATNNLIPNVIKESAFGRKYYQGFNLQSLSKVVREAALGNCYAYDIENSVFAWKMDLVRKIDPTFKMPASFDYIDFKKKYREDIAQYVFKNDVWSLDYKVNVIKQAITAIGFGARATNAAWKNENDEWTTTALRNIIKDSVRLNLFLTHPWIKEFITEQNNINKIIGDYIRPRLKDVQELYNERGNFSVNKAISYCYQHSERDVIEKLMTISGRDNVILLVHDGFYTQHSLNNDDMRHCLLENNQFARLECRKISQYRYYDATDEFLHKQHIIQEEKKARQLDPNHRTSVGYKPKLTKPEFNREFDNGGGWDADRSLEYQIENYEFEEYDASIDDVEYLESRQTKWF